MKKLLLGLILILLIPYNVQAITTNDQFNDLQQEQQLESLYQYITQIKSKYEIMEDMSPKEYIENYMKTGNGNISIKNLLKSLFSYMVREIASSMKMMLSVIIITIVCALLKNLEDAFNNENITNIAYFACYYLIIIIILKNFNICVKLVIETVKSMSDFMLIIIPIMLSLLASAGGFVEASMMDSIIIVLININSRLFLNIIIPLILIGIVLKFVNNISSNYKINNFTKFVGQLALWGEGIIMTVFVGVISIKKFTSMTIDSVSAKTVKYAVDNFVPIVGKYLSDAISTVAGYSILLKNAVGTLGIIIIIFIVIIPILKIFIIAFLYKLTVALIEPVSNNHIINCINDVGGSLIILGSVLICVSLMFFITLSIISTCGIGVVGG